MQQEPLWLPKIRADGQVLKECNSNLFKFKNLMKNHNFNNYNSKTQIKVNYNFNNYNNNNKIA